MAYGLPVYLHFALKNDTATGLVFWWNASTCRHLGFGGKTEDPQLWEAQKVALKTYMKYKQFYAQGTFYGLDEMVHAHTLKDKNMSVMNVFNLETHEVEKEIRFKLSEIGLQDGFVTAEGAPVETKGDEVVLWVKVPARGHTLVVLQVGKPYGKLTSKPLSRKYSVEEKNVESAKLASDWLAKQKGTVSESDYQLLARAQATLLANIADPNKPSLVEPNAKKPEDIGKPLPWHPLRGIYPSVFFYLGVWSWDGPFHAVGVSRWDPQLAREQLEITLRYQQESGLLPDVVFENGDYVKDFGKPPIMPWACMRIDQIAPDDEFLAMAYKKFLLYEKHLMKNRGGAEEGLFHYGGLANLEAGWDNSVRWDNGCENLWTIDMNCCMVTFYQSMAYIAKRLNLNDDQKMWLRRSDEVAKRINDTLWDEQAGAYVDRDRNTKEFSKVLTPASFMPLYAGIVSKDRADRLAKLASDPDQILPGHAVRKLRQSRVSEFRLLAWTNVAECIVFCLERSQRLRLR